MDQIVGQQMPSACTKGSPADKKRVGRRARNCSSGAGGREADAFHQREIVVEVIGVQVPVDKYVLIMKHTRSGRLLDYAQQDNQRENVKVFHAKCSSQELTRWRGVGLVPEVVSVGGGRFTCPSKRRWADSIEPTQREKCVGTAERDKCILKTACVKAIRRVYTMNAAPDGAFAATRITACAVTMA